MVNAAPEILFTHTSKTGFIFSRILFAAIAFNKSIIVNVVNAPAIINSKFILVLFNSNNVKLIKPNQKNNTNGLNVFIKKPLVKINSGLVAGKLINRL